MPKPKSISEAAYLRMKNALKKEAARLMKQAALLERVDHEVWAVGRDLFTTDAELALWLSTPARALYYATPLTVLRTKAGRARVLNLIGAVANGGGYLS